MSKYAIGDVQGCYDELLKLLQKFHFDEGNDELIFIGDLVNRGPKSLETLRFVKKLEKSTVILGNHDLHLLAIESGAIEARESDTLSSILSASDCHELCTWLRQQKLLHHDDETGYTLLHAGLPPQWDLDSALFYAKEVEDILKSDNYRQFFNHMYGNKPDHWDDELVGWDRLRVITNYLTRARFLDKEGRLHFEAKGEIGSQPEGFMPWYEVPDRKNKDLNVIFGHWAALGEKLGMPNVHNIDTGCVWGNCLTAIRLETGEKFSVNC